jgi:hypothetical protein
MVLIRNLMQIFATAELIPGCYCTCWPRFSARCFQKVRFIDSQCLEQLYHLALKNRAVVTEGQVPRCPKIVGKRPYNQKLEGIAPFFPQRTLTSEYA